MRVGAALLAAALLACACAETDEGQWRMGELDSGESFWWRSQPGNAEEPEITFDEPPGQWKLGKARARRAPPRARARASTPPPPSSQLDSRDGGNTYRWRTGADGGIEVQLWRKAYLDSGRPYWWRRVADGAEPEVRPRSSPAARPARQSPATGSGQPHHALDSDPPPPASTYVHRSAASVSESVRLTLSLWLTVRVCPLPRPGASRRPARARGAGRAPRRAAVRAGLARIPLAARRALTHSLEFIHLFARSRAFAQLCSVSVNRRIVARLRVWRAVCAPPASLRPCGAPVLF